MIFDNKLTNSETKIAVLEERLSSYEVMMRKIDEAIQIMGKTSQNISKMLAVHEEKIDQCSKTDESISKSIEDMRSENKSQHKEVEKRIDGLEVKIDEVVKFRWMILGAVVFITFALSQSPVIIDILTPDPQPVRIEGKK
jgi:chromosome segregation ATPase